MASSDTPPDAGVPRPTRRVLLLGSGLLIFQILFAANNFGPQRIPGLNVLVDGPWVRPASSTIREAEGFVRFADTTTASGLDAFVRPKFHNADPAYIEVMGGGVAAGDYDGDGWDDILLVSMPPFDPSLPAGSPTTLFRNRGNGTFEDVTRTVGLDRVDGYAMGALWFDYDNDGDPDLYVTAYDGGQLFRNDAGRFSDVTTATGLDITRAFGDVPAMGSSAAAADFDRDGHLDLLIVCNVGWSISDPAQRGERNLFPVFLPAQRTFLFRNTGSGTFVDVSDTSGVTNTGGKGLGAVWVDVDDNLWPDVYIANDLSPNTLYLNNADGTFTEIAQRAGVAEIKSSMGVAAGDYDNDGRMDLAVTNLRGTMLSLFQNRGDRLFEYVTTRVGLTGSTRNTGWGIEFVDFDLDGHLDLVSAGGPVWDAARQHTRNMLFRNQGDGTFAEVTDSRITGDLVGHEVSRGLAILDYDGDGRPDIIVANVDGDPPRLLRNVPLFEGRWLDVRLEGTRSNRDGVGARVELTRTDGVRLVQEVRAGGSYQSTSTRTLFFGLAESDVARLVIRWPSGAIDTLSDVEANQVLRVREGTSPN